MPENENYEYSVELEHITKKFGKQIANEDVTIRLKKGEIHALLGENGAGKSTLMNILFGLIKPDSGTIKINGQVVDINNPNDATAYGIGMVHQHFELVDCFTALENIILGVEETKGMVLDKETAAEKIKSLCEKYDMKVEPGMLISEMSVGMQQRVEILKMLYRDNDILIFDEPTAVLTPQEIDGFLKLLTDLADSGKSILFITHKLNEIKAVADRCSVLRKGKYIDTFDVSSVSEEEMSEKMVGRKVDLNVNKSACVPGDVILKVDHLLVHSNGKPNPEVNDVSFDIHAGEIVCIAGIDGNGQSELIYAITGLMKAKSGSITLNGKNITSLSVREHTEAGMAHVPEDRLKYGLVESATLTDNMILKSYYTPKFQNNNFIKHDETTAFAEAKIKEFDIAVLDGPETIAGSMSGGNQQKAVIARELADDPSLFIAAQPVRGLDVGAIEYIRKQIIKVRDSGSAVLMLSFDLNEVMSMSDRILVMFEGKIVADLKPEETDTQELGLYMAGAGKEVER